MRRNADELAKMRRAGRVVAEIHEATRAAIRPGVTTADLDRVAREVLDRRGAGSNFLNYHGFPAVVCTSPNAMIVHGIPSETVILEEGDIISVDCGAIIEGYHGDAAYTMGVGEVTAEADRLMEVTEQSLCAGIDQLPPGQPAPRGGPGRPGGGRGGRVLGGPGVRGPRHRHGHARGAPGPQLLARIRRARRSRRGWSSPSSRWSTPAGPGTVLLDDGWSVVTADGRLSAHFEHTIAVTEDGPEVFTVL